MQSTGVKKLMVIHVPADLVVTPKEAVVCVGDIVDVVEIPECDDAFIQVVHIHDTEINRNYISYFRPEEVQEVTTKLISFYIDLPPDQKIIPAIVSKYSMLSKINYT